MFEELMSAAMLAVAFAALIVKVIEVARKK